MGALPCHLFSVSFFQQRVDVAFDGAAWAAMQNQRILFLAFFVDEGYVVSFGVFYVDLVCAERGGFVLVIHEVNVPFEDEVEEAFIPDFGQHGFIEFFREFSDELFVFFVEIPW